VVLTKNGSKRQIFLREKWCLETIIERIIALRFLYQILILEDYLFQNINYKNMSNHGFSGIPRGVLGH